MTETLIILLAAFTLDLTIGDPVYRLHPIRLIGNVISTLENLLFKCKLSGFFGGVLLLILSLSITLGVYFFVFSYAMKASPALAFTLNIFTTYSCLAFNDLITHVKRVAKALEGDGLKKARDKVQMIVGRDASKLDRFGVARAAIESLSESFVDGLLSPVFWFVLSAYIARHLSFSPILGWKVFPYS